MTDESKQVPLMLRLIGARLRDLREQADITGLRLSHQMGCSGSRISRMESGKRGLNEAAVCTYLSHCGVPIAVTDAVVTLLDTRCAGYRVLRNDVVSIEDLEAIASTQHVVAPRLVPELLQIEPYARHLCQQRGLSDHHTAEAIAQLKRRQEAMRDERQTAHTSFLIGESALRRIVASPATMNEQLLHLALLRSHPRISVRIVPESHARLLPQPFSVLDPESQPAVMLRIPHASVLIEHPTDLLDYHADWVRLSDAALASEQSVELIVQHAGAVDSQPPDT